MKSVQFADRRRSAWLGAFVLAASGALAGCSLARAGPPDGCSEDDPDRAAAQSREFRSWALAAALEREGLSIAQLPMRGIATSQAAPVGQVFRGEGRPLIVLEPQPVPPFAPGAQRAAQGGARP